MKKGRKNKKRGDTHERPFFLSVSRSFGFLPLPSGGFLSLSVSKKNKKKETEPTKKKVRQPFSQSVSQLGQQPRSINHKGNIEKKRNKQSFQQDLC
mmetsp:Transcript_45838/g.90283  ORF Transcript_45838/g.90283 Transcript_45838/m.90283 type:complete len:96 (-) Transcript_45838:202-489(-)